MKRDSLALAHDEPVRLSAERDFRLGDLDIHPSVSEATRGEIREHVEPRVMQVLVALASAGGAVVSRDELIQRCWDGRIVGEAAINRCISRLRALADRGDGTRSFNVETIARVGYRLQPVPGAVLEIVPPPVVASPPRRNRLALVALACAGLATAAVAVAVASHYGAAPSTPDVVADLETKPSIAVLPFKNLSAAADGAYFAEAIQDEILTRLAKIGSLKVISRTSAVEAAKNPGALADIARTLGVANVLEGSVQRAGDRVRVNVQLIRAATDDHLWAEAYDRRLDDVLAVENDIAGSIATALAAKITPGESRAIATTPTTNGEAYDLYLHALVLYEQYDETQTPAALETLKQAVAIDPEFALAWALIAQIESNAAFDGDPPERELAHEALDRAMALAPDLVEVQLAHAQYRHYVELDYAGAAEELRALHARWPNNTDVLRSLAFIARRLGHFEEALAYFRRAQALDPLARSNFGFIAETLDYAHRPEEAMKVVAGARAIWPEDAGVIVCEATHRQAIGDLDRADAGLMQLPASVDARGDTLEVRRAQYAYRRRFTEGIAWFEALRASAPVQDWDPVQRATLDLALGDFRRWSGDAAGARESYEAAANALREKADHAVRVDPNAIALSAIAYSGLGDREAALRYANRLAEAPLIADGMNGASSRESIARTFARLGDRDAAIAALERATTEPGRMTRDQLRMDPDFDAMRGESRFERLLADSITPLE